ncbi:OTU domain-containing protein 7B [Aplysia californica]|uniref:ubiquitinyl hydrolase 1 n=1 Tax=Aplysia californica TaxID=6500 RepID=A0ABM0JYM6_APLCA|nr:OTU domain-containing protein 7B [Aplysia californica]XP_035827273.1 OTU domain-containing protein 7B [Aplysia californica]
MDLQRERTLKIEQFMTNTGTDKSEAVDILSRNKWSLPDSYREIEELCISSARNKSHKFDENDKQQSTSSPHHRAIEMGRGAAVNLDKKAAPTGMVVVMPLQEKTNSLPQDMRSVSNDSHLSVRLPPSANKNERIIPIQIQGGGKGNAVQPNSGLYKPSYAGSPVDNSRPSPSPSPSPTYSGHPAGSRGGPSYPHARSVIDEIVYPTRPSMVPPPMSKEQALELQENDDVFDDKSMKKPPSTNYYPRLKRGFSNILENEGLVSEARHNVQVDIKKDSHDHMYTQSFVLPDLTAYTEDFRAFLEKELVETSTLVSLEQAGRLNWWAELRLCQRLLPMATSGDGNCLLHAASLAMWGIHDRQLILRKELHETLTKAHYKNALYRRWRYQQTMSNKESGLVFSEAEWSEEWENILRLASPLPRGAPDPTRSNNCCDSAVTQGSEESVVYESLEEFHVFVLAHVLQRPIIVVADAILRDSSGEALAPIPFPGVYLPMEVAKCFRSPLLLTYDAAHFSALCPMEQDHKSPVKLPAAIPLVDPELKLLPLHFYVDPGPHVDWSKNLVLEPSLEDRINLLQKFMEVERIPFRTTDLNGDSDRGSCGSQDSDESGAILRDKDKKKEDKKKDARMSQQMQSVAKQFGSIGKSMGKKLKQLGKSGKGDKPRRPSVGNEITQSTRVISSFAGSQGSGRDFVLVANLSEKRSPNHQKMIKNYLEDAKERFQRDRELKRKSDIELRSRVSNPSSVCGTPGCNAYGTAQNGYLCGSCYSAQQREQSIQQRAGGQYIYNTFPGRARLPAGGTYLAPEEIFRYGKSKFYTSSNEDINEPAQPVNLAVSSMDRQTSQSHNNVNYPRCPSPDYDNASSGQLRVNNSSVPNNQQTVNRMSEDKCRNPNCSFFGRAEWSGFCSKCWTAIKPASNSVRSSTKL